MDYLLFNEDGSIKQSNLNQYVQEGDNNKQVLVAVIGLESGTALPEAICRLPNGQSVTLAGVWNEDEHGWIFTFTSSVTLYPGVVLVAIRISENGINRVMYPFSLMVNQTGVNPNTDTGISLEELDAYLLTIKNWINALNIENGSGENSIQQKGNTASGEDSFAHGHNSVASNVQSHAEGYGTKARGNFSHSEGFYTIAHADISHTEGEGNVVGDVTETEVRGTGLGGHAEGYGNIVLGKYGHAEGCFTTAKGFFSHSQGLGANTLADNVLESPEIAITEFDEKKYIKNTNVGHGISYDSENNLTYISGARFGDGTQSFADFLNRISLGSIVRVLHRGGLEFEQTYEVHSKGADYFYLKGQVEWMPMDTYLEIQVKQFPENVYSGTAYGLASFVGGYHNVALQPYQTVFGKYNDNKSDTLFEIGNGGGNNSRSNAFEVCTDGTLRIPNFDSNGNKIGMVKLKCVNGILTIIV